MYFSSSIAPEEMQSKTIVEAYIINAEIIGPAIRQQKKYNWEFIFLGANIDAIGVASRMGISEDRAANFVCDEQGTELNYEVLNEAVGNIRQSKALKANWKAKIEEDYKKRKQFI